MVLKKTLANYQWAIGVEHEMHIFLLNRNIVKHYNIIETENACRYILENWEILKKKYSKRQELRKKIFTEKNREFLQDVYMRKFEASGRKCNGKWVLKPVTNNKDERINMPEFVSTNPFSTTLKRKTIESYCTQIDKQQTKFSYLIGELYPNIRSKIKTKKHNITAFPYGMTNYIKVEKKPKLERDYAGSFHITITLPFTDKTTDKVFIKNHQNFANHFQWIEPLLIPGFFSADDKSIGTKEKRIKGSFRVCSVGWGNFAGSDVRKFKEGVGRFTNLKFDWRKGLDYYQKEKVKNCNYIKDITKISEPHAKSRYSSNFRTFGGPKRESGYKMEKPSGIEIRIFDNISTLYSKKLCKLIVFIAEHSRSNNCSRYVYHDKDWVKAIQTVMLDGWNAKLPIEYINKLRKFLNLKLDIKSVRVWDILKEFTSEIHKKNKDGLWCKLLLNSNKAIKLICINRLSSESGFILRLNNNKILKQRLIKLYENLPDKCNFEEFRYYLLKYLNKDDYQDHVENIAYFLQSINLLILTIKDGDIITLKKIKNIPFQN